MLEFSINPNPDGMTMQAFRLRQKARRYAMQALYGWLISGSNLSQVKLFYYQDRNPNNYDRAYFDELLEGVASNLASVDAEIAEHIDRPFKDLSAIDLSILRIASFEMLYRIELPFRVIIHEAVDLAKIFGADGSYRFANRVLDKMAHKLRSHELNEREHA